MTAPQPFGPMACSAFLGWSHKAGYSTCTSDIQIALAEAWNAGIAEKERETTSLRHTITLLKKEAVGMEMELDCSCNAEELRTAQAENAAMRKLLFRFSCNTACAKDAHDYLQSVTMSCTAPKEKL